MSKFLDNLSLIYSLISLFLLFFAYFFASYIYLPYYFEFFIATFSVSGLIIGLIALFNKPTKRWKPVLGIILNIIILFVFWLFSLLEPPPRV